MSVWVNSSVFFQTLDFDFKGEFNTHADLTAMYPPAINAGAYAYVLTSTGVPLINRQGQGLYRSDGSAWTRNNIDPYFTSNAFRVIDATDGSKRIAFDLTALATATTRNYSWPDKDGTVALLDDITGGDVDGPASAVDNNLAAFDGVTGKLIKDALVSISQVPTVGEKAGLVGSNGVPGAGNPYVTDSDPRNSNARVPTGPAGLDLGGSYPDPEVVQATGIFTLLTGLVIGPGSIIHPPALTGDVDDWNPAGFGPAMVVVLESDNAGAHAINGMAAPGPGDSNVKYLYRRNGAGMSNVVLDGENLGSLAANRFESGNNKNMGPGDGCMCIYDGVIENRWLRFVL